MSRFSVVSQVTNVLPFVGVLPQFVKEPNELAIKLMRATDEVVPVPLGPATVYLVHHPDHLKHILLDNRDNYWKGPMFQRADIMVGNGLVLSDGKHWRRQRKLMQPHFKPKRFNTLLPTLTNVIAERIERWGDEGPADMMAEMSCITMTALLKWLFSYDIEDATIDRFDALFAIMAKHVEVRGPTWFLPEWFPLPGRTEALKASKEMRSKIGDIIDARRRSRTQPNDLLDMLLEARDEAGRGMTREQIIDEVQTVVFGGYDSTAASMSWTWHMLAMHPEAARRVQQEMNYVIPEAGMPSLQQLGQLEYFERVFKETLRMYPAFGFNPRAAREADRIGNVDIPAGATLIYSVLAAHRNPKFWEHPDAFYPDHFVAKRVAARHRYAFVPFGGGPRVCIGMHVAMLEAKIMFALALRQFEIGRAIGNPSMMSRMGTGRPEEPIRVELRRRVRPQPSVRHPSSMRGRRSEPPPSSYLDRPSPSYRIIRRDSVPPPSRRSVPPPAARRSMPPPSMRHSVPPPSMRHSVPPPTMRHSVPPASMRHSVPPPSMRHPGPPASMRHPGPPPSRRHSVPPPSVRRSVPPPSIRRSIPPPSVRRAVSPPSVRRSVPPATHPTIPPPPAPPTTIPPPGLLPGGPMSVRGGSGPLSMRRPDTMGTRTTSAARLRPSGGPNGRPPGVRGARAGRADEQEGCPFHQQGNRRRSTVPPSSIIPPPI